MLGICICQYMHEELQKVMIHQAFLHTRNSTHTNAPVSSVEPFTRAFAGVEPREQMSFSLFRHMREYACTLCIKCMYFVLCQGKHHQLQQWGVSTA